jgi:hypothetical protein
MHDGRRAANQGNNNRPVGKIVAIITLWEFIWNLDLWSNIDNVVCGSQWKLNMWNLFHVLSCAGTAFMGQSEQQVIKNLQLTASYSSQSQTLIMFILIYTSAAASLESQQTLYMYILKPTIFGAVVIVIHDQEPNNLLINPSQGGYKHRPCRKSGN